MKHIADNIYYITPLMLRHRLNACYSGAHDAVVAATGQRRNSNVAQDRRILINLRLARRTQLWRLQWLANRLRTHNRISRDEHDAFNNVLNNDTHYRGGTSAAVADAFMVLIEAMARRQRKLPTPCPTCGR